MSHSISHSWIKHNILKIHFNCTHAENHRSNSRSEQQREQQQKKYSFYLLLIKSLPNAIVFWGSETLTQCVEQLPKGFKIEIKRERKLSKV